MTEFLENQQGWLIVERLSGYAHDLNPSSRCGPT
jgi:hypothetical protein